VPARSVFALLAVVALGAGAFLLLRGGDAASEDGDREADTPGRADWSAGDVSEAARKRLERLMALDHRPSPRMVDVIEERDLPAAAKIVEGKGELPPKQGLVWLLGLRAGERSTEPLQTLLLRDYEQQELEITDETVLHDTLQAMGFASTRDKRAYDFLLRGTDPSFWRSKRTWKSTRGAHATHMLVAYSIQAIGLSGRPEAKDDVRDFKKRDAVFLHDHGGDIVQAVFNQHLRRSRGEAGLKEYLLTAEDDSLFNEWSITPEGRSWIAWANSKMRGPRPKPN